MIQIVMNWHELPILPLTCFEDQVCLGFQPIHLSSIVQLAFFPVPRIWCRICFGSRQVSGALQVSSGFIRFTCLLCLL